MARTVRKSVAAKLKAARKDELNQSGHSMKPEQKTSGLKGVSKAKDKATTRKSITQCPEDPLAAKEEKSKSADVSKTEDDEDDKMEKKEDSDVNAVAKKKQEKTPKRKSRTITGSGAFVVTPTSQSSKKGGSDNNRPENSRGKLTSRDRRKIDRDQKR